MSSDIRDYLIERFRSDAATLRQRAATIAAANKPAPGPDAPVSRAMADACDEVASLSEKLPERASVAEIVAALEAMLPALTTCANQPAAQKTPAVKSVYIGASKRIQELIAAELNAARQGDAPPIDQDDEDEE